MKAVLHGPQGSSILESALFTIGSSPDNSLVIDTMKVSAHHAEIRLEDQSFSVTDLGSIHGTYVNGERLAFNTPHLLGTGNSVAFGDSVFTFDETPQTEEIVPTSLNQEDGTEKLESHSPAAYSMSTMSESPENQERLDEQAQISLQQQTLPSNVMMPDNIPFIPVDYNGPIPGYVPLKQVKRRERRFILIGLGLLIVMALAVGSYFFFTRSTPEKTLDAFCTAMQGQDYQTAYNQLSNALQNSETEIEFAGTSQAGGKVSACTHGYANTANNKASANVKLVTSSGQEFNSKITLVTDNSNAWKMNLYPTTPGMTLTAFCNALQNKDLPTAYSQLTSGIKRQHAEAQFETDFVGLTCSYNAISPTGIMELANVMFKNTSGQSANAKISLIQDGESNNIWKINSISFV